MLACVGATSDRTLDGVNVWQRPWIGWETEAGVCHERVQAQEPV